ncbi:endoplasmic reticulum-Golgi intermediate compartment protein 3 isoform X2 [Phymastichus coffea]|nr:endoplasmic reticulum-Golgi intermediate compartment protein 3 isoform X2 [Phymastichus coffea]
MVLLFLSELYDFVTPTLKEELFVDTSRGSKLKINFDFIIPSVSCSILCLDAADATGEQHLWIDHNVYKRRLDLDGKPIEEPKKTDITEIKKTTIKSTENTTTATECGDCYGAQSKELGIKCCNSCEAVKKAYAMRKWAIPDPSKFVQCKSDGSSLSSTDVFSEGCQIYGYIEVNKVAGSFHVMPGDSLSIDNLHLHNVAEHSISKFNMSHKIRHLSFGTNIPGKTNPIDNSTITALGDTNMFQYYVKVVPTTFVRLDGSILQTNQFSVTRSFRKSMPGIVFNYELSPLMVKYTQTQKSIGHFLTNTCAIIGGTFTTASIFDSFLYHSVRAIQKKIELGKLN